MMLLMGMWMSLTKKPMKPMIAKPIAVARAIFWNSAKKMRWFTVMPRYEKLFLWFKARCSLGIRDWRILCLLRRILRLRFGSLWLFFYSDVEPLSKCSPVTLQFSPATRILNENPAKALIQSRLYIEDIRWQRGDTKFLFKCWKIFHEWARQTSEIFFQHEKRNFISPRGHVMFYLLYKHQ